jgi:Arc/MetJ-type ribon-helix-helix transcriptional regulator
MSKTSPGVARSANRKDKRDPVVGVRLPRATIARIDRYAQTIGAFRSDAIRSLLERALQAAEAP